MKHLHSIRRPAAPDLDGIVLLAQGSPEAPHWPRQEYERIVLAGERPAQNGELALQRFPLVFPLVLELDGALAGFAVTSWLPGDKAAVLETILIDPNCRRRGLGEELLSLSMLMAQRAGARAMRLEVRASNSAALALYLGKGFLESGRRRAYYSAPVEDALLLERVLESFQDGEMEGKMERKIQ